MDETHETATEQCRVTHLCIVYHIWDILLTYDTKDMQPFILHGAKIGSISDLGEM